MHGVWWARERRLCWGAFSQLDGNPERAKRARIYCNACKDDYCRRRRR
jgi:hypothetical protein